MCVRLSRFFLNNFSNSRLRLDPIKRLDPINEFQNHNISIVDRIVHCSKILGKTALLRSIGGVSTLGVTVLVAKSVTQIGGKLAGRIAGFCWGLIPLICDLPIANDRDDPRVMGSLMGGVITLLKPDVKIDILLPPIIGAVVGIFAAAVEGVILGVISREFPIRRSEVLKLIIWLLTASGEVLIRGDRCYGESLIAVISSIFTPEKLPNLLVQLICAEITWSLAFCLPDGLQIRREDNDDVRTKKFIRAVLYNDLSSLAPDEKEIREDYSSVMPAGMDRFFLVMIDQLMRCSKNLQESNTPQILHPILADLNTLRNRFKDLTSNEKNQFSLIQVPSNPSLQFQQFIRDSRNLAGRLLTENAQQINVFFQMMAQCAQEFV